MIRYALHCSEGHDFESWFQSSEAYDALSARGLLSCAVCGGSAVSKAMMAPRVGNEATQEGATAPVADDRRRELAGSARRLRDRLERETTWVGDRFPTEVRAIRAGEAPNRALWGEAKPSEARALLEEGIRIAPVPFGPRKKMT
jgi:hypothetical protein